MTFKVIPDYPDYEINEEGVVRNIKKQSILSTPVQHYKRVSLYKDGKLYGGLTVHSLVMSTFVGPLPPGNQVRHLDGDPLNNTLSNLSYGTPTENQADRITHDTAGMKLTVRKVRVIRGLFKCGFKRKRLAEMFDIHIKTVSHIIHRRSWKTI